MTSIISAKDRQSSAQDRQAGNLVKKAA